MSGITLPRAFPSFDPAIHVQKCKGVAESIRCVMIGADFGSTAPCVALHGALMPNKSMRIFREDFEPGIGLEAFVDGGALGSVDGVDLICAERACVAKSPINNQSSKELIEGAGFKVLVCKSSPRWRHDSINARLKVGDGAGGIVVDASCTNLISMFVGHRQAFGSGGHWRSATPRYQHCADALGYLVEGFARWLTTGHVACTGIALDEIA